MGELMTEKKHLVSLYQDGLFVEAIPTVLPELQKNLLLANSMFGTNFKARSRLVTSQAGKSYDFNVFNNKGQSSSIYKPNGLVWKWNDVKHVDTISLTSTTIKLVLQEEGWENKAIDVILDVQGAELEVLKGFGDNIQNVAQLTTEVSLVDFYNGGVLFKELHDFLCSYGFTLLELPKTDHFDVTYVRR